MTEPKIKTKTVTTKELVTLIHTTGLTKSVVENVIKEAVKIITNCVVSGQSVRVEGLGTFSAKLSKERVARNPKNQQAVVRVPSRYRGKFKAAAAFNKATKGIEV
jgi:integration host factor subunit alpha